MGRMFLAALLAMLTGCSAGNGGQPTEDPHPSLMFKSSHKDLILERSDREPYATVLARIQERAQRDWREAVTEYWDHDAHGQNAQIARANAILAWLYDDRVAAEKAIAFFDGLTTNFEDHENWDVNIRMPAVLMSATDTWDLLSATPWFTENKASVARDKITQITAKFYEGFVVDDTLRMFALGFSQNNHPIRTACAIGYPALLFTDHPKASAWLDWAVSELAYLWGENGQYVQADGGVSEGPHYFDFALAPSIAFFIALDNRIDPERSFRRNCINRRNVDPWQDHGCVDRQSFTFASPIHEQRFWDTALWSLSIRLPSGYRPPLADAETTTFNGGALLPHFGAQGHFRWDWETAAGDLETTRYYNLNPHHLVYFDDSVAAVEPPFTTRFLPAAGNAIFRSGWDADALWMLLMAENGSARKTLHDHVDGTSFTLAAYGEYLLIDTGYYKPNDLDNARTAHSAAHSVIQIDGQGAPDKGLLNDFGDADSFLENTLDGAIFDYAEARQDYRDNQIVRGIVFARNRYFVVADRLSSERIDPREYRWRLHANAGHTAGGSFALEGYGASWEREKAGLQVYLSATVPGLEHLEPPFVEDVAPHVHQFDEHRTLGHHAVYDGTVTAAAPDFLGILAPYGTDAAPGAPDSPLTVTLISASEGQAAYLVTGSDSEDLVFLREPGADQDLTLPDKRVVTSDAALLVLGLSDGAALLARGTRVQMDGATIVELDAESGVAIAE